MERKLLPRVTYDENCKHLAARNKSRYEALKSELLKAGARGEVKVSALPDILEYASRLRRFAERVLKGVEVLKALSDITHEPYRTPAVVEAGTPASEAGPDGAAVG